MSPDAGVGTPELVEAARKAIDVLDLSGVRYALIGGIAVARHGIVRPTRDIDLLLAVERLRLPGLLDAFHAAGFAFDAEPVIRQLGQDGMSQLAYGRTPVDLLAPVLPWFADALGRARREPVLGRRPPIAIPEDAAGRDAPRLRRRMTSIGFLELNVRLAQGFTPMPEEERATLLSRVKPSAGTGLEFHKT